MATTHVVKWGDTLSEIALYYRKKGIDTSVSKIAKLNHIENVNFIVEGQILKIDGDVTAEETNKTSKAIIKAFGLQTNTTRSVYASWNWSKSNTENYQVKWYYDTGDGIWFVGDDSTVTDRQSLYSAPENALSVKFMVKPISKKRTVNNKETSYWTANWSTAKTYAFANNPPSTPPVPNVEIKKYTLTAELDNLDVNATTIEFQVVKDDKIVFKTGKATISTAHAAFSCTVTAGSEYKVRCRAIRGKSYSDWSNYSSSEGTPPAAPSRITACEAATLTSVYVEWPEIKNATSYELEYTTDKKYFDTTDAPIKVECSTNIREVLDLETGKEYFFRVRACNDKGESDWSQIVSTTLGSGPAAPTTWSSATSVTVGEPLILYWIHNSSDGSKQTAAQVELTAPDGTTEVHTVTVSTDSTDTSTNDTTTEETTEKAQGYNVETSNYTEGSQLYWRVRTKGILKGHTWADHEWEDVEKLDRSHIWTDGTHTYYSYQDGDTDMQYIIQDGEWVIKIWGDIAPIDGMDVWTDTVNYYYSAGTSHFILQDGAWVKMEWKGLTDFYGHYIWNDGTNTYYSNSSTQYVLGENDTWTQVTWKNLTKFEAAYIWAKGNKRYYSYEDEQYELGTDYTWISKTWGNFNSLIGSYIWVDDIGSYHHSNGSEHYILNENSWQSETWAGLTEFTGNYVWTDGNRIYYSKYDSETSVQKVVSEDYGKWSVERLVNIYAQPTLDLTMTTSSGAPVTTLDSYPFYVSATPYPENQTPLSYQVTITCNNDAAYETVDSVGNPKIINPGDTIYSGYFDTSEKLMLELSAGSLTLENNISYTLNCIVAMDSGLTAENSIDFDVQWSDSNDYEPNAEISLDEERYATYIRPYCEDENGKAISDVTLDVYRCNYDGSFTAINDEPIVSGSNVFITDPHPALNYARYRIVARSLTTGTITYCDIPNYPIGGKSIVIQWDEQWSPFDTENEDALEKSTWAGSMLMLPYNIDVSDNPTPDVSLVEYIGRQHPVSYYGTQLGETSTWSVAIPKTDTETLYGLRRLGKWQGDVYVREPSGTGYWANILVSYSQAHADPVIPVTFDVTRVEGGK